MPWKTKNEQEQRYELVRVMVVGREPIAQLSRRWSVSRKTAYKWLRRYQQQGLRGIGGTDHANRCKWRSERPSICWRGCGGYDQATDLGCAQVALWVESGVWREGSTRSGYVEPVAQTVGIDQRSAPAVGWAGGLAPGDARGEATQ